MKGIVDIEKWPVRENDLAEKTGASREWLRSLRATLLVKDADWVLQGCWVRLSKNAADRLCAAINAGPPPEAVAETNAAQAMNGDDGVVELRVVRPVTNPRIVMAALGEELVRLRVKDSRKFPPGMAVSAREVEGGLYELAGREPRWRGRW